MTEPEKQQQQPPSPPPATEAEWNERYRFISYGPSDSIRAWVGGTVRLPDHIAQRLIEENGGTMPEKIRWRLPSLPTDDDEEESEEDDDEQKAAEAARAASADVDCLLLQPICSACLAKSAPLRCSRCRKVYYCDPACQRVDWERHKGRCKPT
jgi:hypothetical protein